VIDTASTPVTLRCHSCSHAVGTSAITMKLVGLFKPSQTGRVARSHTHEQRKRCDSCGWVNVFHPLRSGEVIELK
jgi:hypothetical protein